MANENITINMENLSETEQKQLLALAEKANKPQNKVWQPHEKERFYYIDDCEGTVETWTFSILNHQKRLANRQPSYDPQPIFSLYKSPKRYPTQGCI